MKITTTIACALGLLVAASPVLAADAARGAQLHQEQCVACHTGMGFADGGNAIYTRAERRVQSLGGLQKQVNRCKNNLKIVWFDEDVADVAAYLNAQFYHFTEKQ